MASNATKDAFRLVERRLVAFGSYSHVRSLLDKYMIGSSYDQELVEKILVILVAEFRQELSKLSGNLPDDEAEAAAVASRRASGKRGRPKKETLQIEVVEDVDLMELEDES